jgi:hypothetical protein
MLTVKAGTSIDPAFAYHVGPPALFVPATRTLVEVDFVQINVCTLGNLILLDIYGFQGDQKIV